MSIIFMIIIKEFFSPSPAWPYSRPPQAGPWHRSRIPDKTGLLPNRGRANKMIFPIMLPWVRSRKESFTADVEALSLLSVSIRYLRPWTRGIRLSARHGFHEVLPVHAHVHDGDDPAGGHHPPHSRCNVRRRPMGSPGARSRIWSDTI